MNELFSRVNSMDLTSTEELIYEFFKENTKSITHMSLQEICSKLYVSNASIIRFCQKLGFKGFNEFKFYIRNEISSEHSSLEFWRIIPHSTERLKDFVETIEEDTMQKICDIILNSDPIYVYGRAMSSHPAIYLYSMLMTMDIQCIMIDWYESLSSIISSIPKNATLILFTTHGNKETYERIIKYCREKDVRVIWMSSEPVDNSLIREEDIYICSNETMLDNTRLMTKMTSFLFVQILVEMLIQRKKRL